MKPSSTSPRLSRRRFLHSTAATAGLFQIVPSHILGLNGMPRRTYRYAEGLGLDLWNLVATVGAFTIALSLLFFFWNWFRTARHGTPAGNDPWDGRTLEWTISSPPPEHNFDTVPVIHSEDDF